MATVDVTQENFEQIIAGHDIVIVDFWAPWCGPCRGFAPVYEAASEKYPDVVFAKVNTEEQQALAGMFRIRSIPTLMVFREKLSSLPSPVRYRRPRSIRSCRASRFWTWNRYATRWAQQQPASGQQSG